MKNKLSLFLIVVSLVALPNLSLANSETSANIKEKIENKKEEIKQKVASTTNAVKNSIEGRKQNATDKMKESVNKFVSKTIVRFSAAANRLEILAIRIDSRIAKIKARGIDESKAEKLLADAIIKIQTAKKSISLITSSANIDSTEASSTVKALKEAFSVTKVQIEKAKKDLSAAHAALIDVVNSLKPGDNKLRELKAKSTATSTATTTNNE
jgi:hypothetical protein